MRIRTIKPEFWMHEGLAGCSEFSRLMALALLNWSDDEGYFFAHHALIRGSLFPFEDDSTKIRRAFAELSSVGYLRLGKDDQGRAVGMVENFSRHQKIDRPKPSEIKASSQFDDESTTNRRMIVDESLLERKGTGNREQGKEQGTRGARDAEFDEFWKAYPKKTGKGAAERAWTKIRPPLPETLSALEWQSQQPGWLKERGQFIPNPATYINEKRWTDEPTAITRPDDALVF